MDQIIHTFLLSRARNCGGVSRGRMLLASKRGLGLYNLPLLSSALDPSVKLNKPHAVRFVQYHLSRIKTRFHKIWAQSNLLVHLQVLRVQKLWLCPLLLQKKQGILHRSLQQPSRPPVKDRLHILSRLQHNHILHWQRSGITLVKDTYLCRCGDTFNNKANVH